MQEHRINKYNKYVVAEDFILVSNYNSVMEFPFFLRAVINTTSKEYLIDKKQSINALAASFLLSGQKTIPTRAKKSIAGFKLREGALIGCRTTLRKKKLYAFLDKLLIFVLPRLYSEKKDDTIFEVASLLFLKKSSKTFKLLQTQLDRVTTTNKGSSFFQNKEIFILEKAHTKYTRAKQSFATLSHQERDKMSMYLSALEKVNTNSIERNEKITSKSAIHHLAIGIKDLLLMPELQEFLPLFETVRGINIGVSFCNPRIKGTFLTKTLLTSNQEFTWKSLVPRVLVSKFLNESSPHPHILSKETNSLKENRKRLVNSNQITYSTFTCNPVDYKERKERVTFSFETDTLIKTYDLGCSAEPINSSLQESTYKKRGMENCDFLNKERRLESGSTDNSQQESTSLFTKKKESLLKKAKSHFTQNQKTEKKHTLNTFFVLSDTSRIKENQKIFFLSCFQYPRKYN